MKQAEMARYLKAITLGVGILLLVSLLWFVPAAMEEMVVTLAGKEGYWGVLGFIWITAIPCFLILKDFWKICGKIGKDESFCRENAETLRRISHYLLSDAVLYTGFLIWVCAAGWYKGMVWILFLIFLILFVCVTLAVLSAALSHLVQKASRMQEEQDLTI